MVFDSPEEHGYKLRFRDVESHRQAMLQPGWKYFLNYETDWMNRDEIVDSTYRSALALNRVKMERGLITRQTYDQVEKRILFSLDVVDKIDAAMKMGVCGAGKIDRGAAHRRGEEHQHHRRKEGAGVAHGHAANELLQYHKDAEPKDERHLKEDTESRRHPERRKVGGPRRLSGRGG